MKKIIIFFIIILYFLATPSSAYWVWTPESGRWVNPKYAVKDTPKEQYDWASSFFEAKDYKRSLAEFRKLANHYPRSEYAPKAQYYVGRCFEELQDYYQAFLAYQQVIDKYPYTEKVDEIIEREYKIAILFFEGQRDKILGIPIVPALDKAIEIFQKVVSNAPYGPYADKAQYQLGLAYKKSGLYDEAIIAFKKFTEQYPKSELLPQAKFELAHCSSRASLKPGYDQSSTDEAIEVFESISTKGKPSIEEKEVDEILLGLKERKAKSLFEVARFYERQRQYRSALIYYKEIVEKYPKTTLGPSAQEKIVELEKRIKR